MIYIKVIAKTGVKKESLVLKGKDIFEISVKEKAKNNMANKRIIEILAIYLKIPKEKIRIVNGHHHPHKLLVVEEKI